MTPTLTVQDVVASARDRLCAAGIRYEEAARDAELLAREALGWDRAAFVTRRNEPTPASFVADFERMIARRERREPVPQIVARREFWGLDLEVTRDVLTPRQETEFIVELAVGVAREMPAPLIVDVGTGSGCIAIALAHELPRARMVATDISPAALQVARRNAARHAMGDRIDFRIADLLTGVDLQPDMIVSNPPYVPPTAAPALLPEVRDHEPAIALFGSGADGLGTIRALLEGAGDKLTPGGWLILEFGYGQDDHVTELASRVPNLTVEKICEDLQGIPRTAMLRRKQ